jgi:nucleoside-diphosphate-sugar epimerase
VGEKDIIYHFAGTTKARNREGYMRGNLLATENLLQAYRSNGPPKQKFVFISSQAAGGPSQGEEPSTEASPSQPVSIYGEAKLSAENAVKVYGEHHWFTIIRPPAVYGPRDRDMLTMFKIIQKGILPLLRGGGQKISMVHVRDLVEGILLAGESPAAKGQLYYISGEDDHSWAEIGHIIARAVDKKPLQIHVPAWVLHIVSHVNLLLSKLGATTPLLNRDKVREMTQSSWLCSNQKAKAELGFQPKVDLEPGIEESVEWYQKVGWL